MGMVIKCNKCGGLAFISETNFDDEIVGSYYRGENGMGYENEHIVATSVCHECGQEIDVRYSYYEYPIGSICCVSPFYVSGGKIIMDSTLILPILQEREIRFLYHFTRINNLPSILANGLFPRQAIDDGIVFGQCNDDERWDGFRNAVCTSISFPNYKMFYQLSSGEQQKWCVIQLNSQILLDFPCAYNWENAASLSMRSIPIDDRMTIDAFKTLFLDKPGFPQRSTLSIPDKYPTNPQAEVLVFGRIPLDYITRIFFYDEESLDSYNQDVPCNISMSVNKEQFLGRIDYPYWR